MPAYDGPSPTLTDALLALQKSFSRVSEATGDDQDRGDARPRSMINGPIDFEMVVSGDIVERDHFQIHLPGAISLKLKGALNHDIAIEAIAPANESPVEADQLSEIVRRVRDELRGQGA